ncbi:hypothetical protein HMI49_40660 [Corallococcus exercitus]|uniref:HNH endonuclease n=1 Tax=Corallococcus exercitus TaxID=2316736 RepID=A0A7Y4KT47_9BACT|nr:hypothetical protein [Corallococcus exercitus]NOK39497.1 hypothetical protein [Corallococcus exercitus]
MKTYEHLRKYEASTLGRLWGLSGNRCAYPDCPSKLIADATPCDDSVIIGHIAHIYSVNSGGPRPYPFEDASKAAINGYDNLLLLCRHHHALVDCQESSFPVEMLKQWKQNHSYQALSTRTSILPERFHEFASMGARFKLQTLDGTITSIGAPVVRSVREKNGENERDVQYVDRQVWIRLDNGHEFELKIQNIDPPGREGMRVTLLRIMDEAGNALPHSIYNHASPGWTQLNYALATLDWSISRAEFVLAGLISVALVGGAVVLPLLFGSPVHPLAPLAWPSFMAISMAGAGVRHWRLWQHATMATKEMQFV